MNKGRYNNSQPLRDIIADILKTPGLSKGIYETRALEAWAKVLGPSVNRVTSKLYTRGGVLYAHLDSSIIRGELLMHKDRIISSINQEVGARVIHELVLK